MKKFFVKNYAYVLLGIIALIFTVISAFGLGNLSSPSTFYQTGEIDLSKLDDVEEYYNSLCYKLDYEDKKYSLDSVWINFGSKDYSKDTSEIVVYTTVASSEALRFYTIASFDKEITGLDTDCAISNTDEAVKVGEWQILCRTPSSYKTYPYFLLSTKNTLKINELAFVGVDENGNRALLTATSVGAGGKLAYKGSDSPLSKSGAFPQTDEAKALADKLIDEQNKFDISKVDFTDFVYKGSGKITVAESYIIESVRNITSGRSLAIDLHANPLGQYLIALGVSVFGATSFGVRIIPFIFALLSLFTVFFIGKLITGKPVYGAIFSFLFLVGGYSLFFATTGKVDAIVAFFILFAFYSVIKFVKKGISDGAQRKGFINIVLGGVSFALAVSVKSTAIFYALPLLGTFAFGVVKQYLFAKRKGANGTSLFKRKFVTTISLGVIGYVFLPIVFVISSFLFAYSSYSAYYGVGGLTEYYPRAFSEVFNTAAYGLTAASITSPIGYIINYSAQAEGTNKFAFGNLALTFINLAALVSFGAYVIYRTIKKKENFMFSSDKSLLTYIALSSFVLFGWLMPCTLKCGIGEFYLPSIFMSGITVLMLKTFNDVDKKPLIGKTLTVTNITAIILAVTVAVFFALAVPSFIGLSAKTSLYAWQVASRAVI